MAETTTCRPRDIALLQIGCLENDSLKNLPLGQVGQREEQVPLCLPLWTHNSIHVIAIPSSPIHCICTMKTCSPHALVVYTKKENTMAENPVHRTPCPCCTHKENTSETIKTQYPVHPTHSKDIESTCSQYSCYIPSSTTLYICTMKPIHPMHSLYTQRKKIQIQ